jgi:hypothetical protein
VFHDRIRWEARAGNIDRKYANIPVPAIAQHGLFWKFLNGYSIKKAEPYNPEQLKDAVVFLPNLSPLDVHDEATMALTKAAEGDCKIAAASDHGRNYSLDADYDQFNWTQMLLPVLCTYYQDDTGKIHPIYINGQNGTICGNRVASTSKGLTVAGIIAAVALFAFILGVVINLLGAAIPPLIVIGTILIIVGVLGGLGALVPALWPYHWNRQQNQYNVFLMDHTSCSNR